MTFAGIQHSLRRATGIAAAVATCLACCAGCEEEEDSYYNHNPPDNQGSIIVVNRTPDDISVYIDSAAAAETVEDEWNFYDLDPGTYRIVLEQQGGTRYFADEVDVLEKRLTILDVIFDRDDSTRYDVELRYD